MKPASGSPSKWRAFFGGAAPKSKLLNLGCGTRFDPAWVNVDFIAHAPEVIKHDLRKPLPFSDGSFSVVYHSHVLEHFSQAFAPVFLRECFRLMEPGGIVRVAVPDLEGIVRAYLKALDGALANDAQAAQRHRWMTIELLDQMVREESGGEMMNYWKQNPMPAEDFVFERLGAEAKQFVETYRKTPQQGPAERSTPKPEAIAKFRETGEVHKWMYDRFSLGQLLAECGFVDVKVCTATASSIPDFQKYHLDADAHGVVRKPDSLFMEAKRPLEK